MTVPELNCWYWFSDKEEFIFPAQLIETTNREGIFRLQNGEERKMNLCAMEQLEKVDNQIFETNIENLIELHSLIENSVLHVLRSRFQEKLIYTFVSSILIAVNPFQNISTLYGIDSIELYHRHNHRNRTLPPHIYALSERAYQALLTTNVSQSIIISGESGAGKTESIKHILRYIAHVSRRHDIHDGRSSEENIVSIQEKIIEANPLMEAFGNSKTSRNNNSSRFGKLMTVKFSAGILVEAKINSYLLEKCRVVLHPTGERNYHIFYQLISAALNDSTFSQQLNLANTTLDFRYAHKDDVEAVPNIHDLESFHDVRKAMTVLGISFDEQLSSLKVVAGILLLGNIEFESTSSQGDGSARLTSPEQIDTIAEILGLSQNELLRCLTSRSFGVRSIVTCFYTIEQAVDARDSFAKKLYSLLFDWLLEVINSNLASTDYKPCTFIAILDIFGFEAFENNSYEQLLINYCNEKLQYHFNNHIFRMEQSEYAREGVDIGKINFVDNGETVELLERKIAGILSMIDEEINVPRGTDETLLNKILKTYAGSPLVKRAKPSGKDRNFLSSFVVTHYAGEVVYNIVGFLEKNRDSMSHDLSQIGTASTNYFVNQLFNSVSDLELTSSSTGGSSSTIAKGRLGNNNSSKKTLGNQFKIQLNSLLEMITRTEPHFIRCLKSNMEKLPQNFNSQVIINQLRYSGLLEVCKIRKCGYPHRYLLKNFHQIYQILCPEASTAHELVEILTRRELLNSFDYCFGTTKIFLRDNGYASLTSAWNDIAATRAVIIQKLIRKFVAKKRVFHLKNTLVNLKKGIKTKNYDLLVESLAVYHHFEYYTAVNRPLISDAKSLVTRLKSEKEINEILENALKSTDIRALESAIDKAKQLTPPFVGSSFDQCVAKVNQLIEARELLIAQRSEEVDPSPPLVPSNPVLPPPSIPPLVAPPTSGQVSEMESSSPQSSSSTDEENKSDFLLPPSRFQRRTIFWPPTSENSFDLSQISNNHRHSITLTGSLLTPRSMKSTSLEASDEYEYESRGRELSKKHSIICSDTRSLSPPISPRLKAHDVPLRSFSPPPVLHVQSNSPPPIPKKGIRTSMLTRQVSTADINDMETIHEIITNLVIACSSEDGITVDDVDPIEQALQQVQYEGTALAKYASELMMAREELARARKQLELQVAFNALTERTPLWKIRNLVQQAEKIGMENYREVKRYRKLFEETGRTDKKVKKY